MAAGRVDLHSVSIPVYILMALFGMSSWIDLNGLWTQFPLLVDVLPEYWNLPSYVVLIIQCGNIGLLAYGLYYWFVPAPLKVWPAIFVIIIIGALGCLMMSFFWDYTTFIGGDSHSTALFVLTGFLSFVDCMSSVVYLTFMGGFKPQYISGYYVGEGLSGLIPALLGLAQGSGGDPICVNTSVNTENRTAGINHTSYELMAMFASPNLSVSAFMLILFGVMCISLACFIQLQFFPYCKRAKLCSPSFYTLHGKENERNMEAALQKKCEIVSVTKSSREIQMKSEANNFEENKSASRANEKKNSPKTSTIEFACLLFIGFWTTGALYGIMPSIMPYSCLPFGNKVFSLAICLFQMTSPMASFTTLFVRTKSLPLIGFIVIIGTGLISFHLYLAFMSPSPPLQYRTVGKAIVVSNF